MADPVIMDVYAELAKYVAEHINLEDVRDFFGDDIEPMGDEDLRKWFAEWLTSDGSDDLIKWYLKVGKPKKKPLSLITTYAVDLPEVGAHATVQCTYDENIGSMWCEVTNVEFDDEMYNDWDDDVENAIMDVFDDL